REYKRRYHEENRDIIDQGKKSRYAQYTRTSSLLASRKGAPYSPEEDALILADNGMTDYQKAIELGRTYYSVRIRKQRLRAGSEHLQLSEYTLREKLKRGEIKSFRIGNSYRIRPEWLEAFIERQEV